MSTTRPAELAIKPCMLSIAGFDSFSGAGLQGDIKTAQTYDVHCFTVATAITAQNSKGVHNCFPLPLDQVESQLNAILEDIDCPVIKIGQLANRSVVQFLAKRLANSTAKLVLDPVTISSSGFALLDETAVQPLIHELLPLCYLITPNIPEAQLLFGLEINNTIDTVDTVSLMNVFKHLGLQNVLIKGGHGITKDSTDWLFHRQSSSDYLIDTFSHPRIEKIQVKGTGCALSTSIAALLTLGYPLTQAVAQAKHDLFQRLRTSYALDYREPSDLRLLN